MTVPIRSEMENRPGDTHGSRARRARQAVLFTVAMFVAYGCAATDSVTTPERAASVTTTALVELVVTVVAPDGKTPVQFATVRAYGAGGIVASATSDAAGLASLSLEAGDYCLSARTIPLEALELDVVAPADAPAQLTPLPAVYGPVVTGRREYVPFTQANLDYCYTQRPVRVGTNGGKETVRMVQPFELRPEVYDANGVLIPDVFVYGVVQITPPWQTNAALPTALLSGFDITRPMSSLVVSPGGDYAVEFQQLFGNFNITGTLKGKAGPGGGVVPLRMEASPLMCKQTMLEFKGKSSGLKFTKVNYGYHAGLDATQLLVPDLDILAIELLHTGSGPVTVTFRTDLPIGQHTTTVDYSCANGDCAGALVKHSGGNPQQLEVFHMNKGGGLAKTTLVLRNIPEHRAVLFGAKTSGDAIPTTSRNNSTDALIAVGQPTICVIEESNDDKWAVGEI